MSGELIERVNRVLREQCSPSRALTVEMRDEITRLRTEIAAYREADEQRRQQGERELAFTQRRLREEADKREAGRWSNQ